LEGFELDAVDYLLNQFPFERFLKGINKVMQINFPVDHSSFPPKENHKEQANSFLYFRADRKMVKVFFNDILFIEALKDYIKL
jgi:DNA-binding LytR/AlgR family response regulator